MPLSILMFLSVFTSVSDSGNTCTNVNNFTNLIVGKYVTGSEFKTLPPTTLLVCVKECQLRQRCASFNFDVSSGDCVLNEGSSTDTSLNFTESSGSVYSEVAGWSEVRSGACASQRCPENTVCRTTAGALNCVAESCMDPPDVDNAQINSSSRYFEIGSVIPYVCDVPYVPAGERKCLPNGTWGGEFKCMRLRSCSDVKACDSSSGNGEYWIYVWQEEFFLLQVYCSNMKNNPNEFITLKGDTFSDIPNRTAQTPCDAWWYDRHCGRTVFNKLRFDPAEIAVKRFHFGYAQTDCLETPLGWVGDCRECVADPARGSARIDTTGTGLKVASNFTWVSHKAADAVVNWSDDGNVITVECVGGCGYCTPTVEAPLYMVVDRMYNINISEATFPRCSV